MLNKSSVFLIFEVAWRSKASMASSRTMPHPLSVIWMSFLPPGFDVELDARCSGIERILQHLLYDRRGALDDLASGDLVGDVFGENVDAAHEAVLSSRFSVLSCSVGSRRQFRRWGGKSKGAEFTNKVVRKARGQSPDSFWRVSRGPEGAALPRLYREQDWPGQLKRKGAPSGAPFSSENYLLHHQLEGR